MNDKEKYLKQLQRRRDAARKRSLARFPQVGAKLRYRGTNQYCFTDIIANAERKLCIGEIYTLKSIEVFLSSSYVTLEETGDAEFSLGFFDDLSVPLLWIALIKVKQNNKNGVLGDTDYAYCKAIGFAENAHQFRYQIEQKLKLLELQLLRLENPEPLEKRLSSRKVHKNLIKLAKDVEKNKQLAFGVFTR